MNLRTRFQILVISMLIFLCVVVLIPFALVRLVITLVVLPRIAVKAYRDGMAKWDLNH